MEWVFETRMEIDELENEDELNVMLRQVQSDYETKIKEIQEFFNSNSFDMVKNELEKTQYLSQMLGQIEDKIQLIRDKDF